MTAEEHYRSASRDADAKKARFLGDVEIAKARVSPTRLKQDVKEKAGAAFNDASERAQDGLRRHPVAIGAAVAGVAAYVFRRPLAALSERVVDYARDHWPQSSSPETIDED